MELFNHCGVLTGWEPARRLVYGELLLLIIFLAQLQDVQGRFQSFYCIEWLQMPATLYGLMESLSLLLIRIKSLKENSFGDVSDKVVADFGCGCGILGIAAALLSAEHVLSIDIDPESLEIASLNAEELELDMDFIQSNVLDLGWRGPTVDTVIMNHPFGTRKKGADLDFLSAACKVASQAVYSLHKTKTRDHVKRAAMRDFNASSAEVLCELRFDVPKLYKFHKKKEVDIAVDLWRFVPGKHQSRGI